MDGERGPGHRPRSLHRSACSGWRPPATAIVLHAHDEAVAEVPDDFGSVDDFLRIFTALPAWASGLPVAAKARDGERWCKISKPEAASEPEPEDEPTPEGLTDDDDGDVESMLPKPRRSNDEADARVMPHGRRAIATTQASSLIDLIGEPFGWTAKSAAHSMTISTPSLHVYDASISTAYGCGAHGDAVDWLMMVEGLDRDAALQVLEQEPVGSDAASFIPLDRNAGRPRSQTAARIAALGAVRSRSQGHLAERYLAEHRGIDLAALPDAAASLRFHPRCPFGSATRHPCLIALRRDAVSDEPVEYSSHRADTGWAADRAAHAGQRRCGQALSLKANV